MKCRHCQSDLTLPFLDLGSAPPSNAYLTESSLNTPEIWFPLRVLVCQSCWLVQTEDHAGREALFNSDYAYFSSTSTSWLAHANNYVQKMSVRFHLGADSRVVEVAANDGYLLQYVQQAGIPCYGVEPTASTAAAARTKGLEVVERFFGVELALELAAQGLQADLMAANNVLAHVPDINNFVAGFAALLKPAGVATFEFPHLLRMVRECQFDTAYHEHYSYLSLTAVQRIIAANGLQVFDVEELHTHGGSLRVFAQRADTGKQLVSPAVARILNEEDGAGMLRADFYSDFQRQPSRIVQEVLLFLISQQQAGKKVGAYGAAAKGNTLLNFAGVRPHLLSYVVDRAEAKQGKFMPGSRIPIVDESHLQADKPDYILILPWNLRDEIVNQLAYAREWGAKFVTAIPRLEIT
nr:class I SAM-dependent methyltransferase [uncultured Rhodoferax sp.]